MSYSSLHHPVFPTQAHFPVFPPAQPASRGPPQVQSSPSAPAAPSSFKAPAHKHAHHLHSIPPREKSTRTLIIDHMLWVHARTRFAQARAELGMTDHTGGPSSPNFRFRERPEQYDEEDEVSSDGEDVDQLKSRAAGHGDGHNVDEDTRMQKQDIALARSLRLRAIALEKVVSSMLDQPPPLHPVPSIGDELQSPPGSPKRRESQTPTKATHPHTLPNGVRLRLALGTVINDLFARQAPIAPYRHHHHPPPIIVSNSLSEKGSTDSVSSDNDSSPVLPNMSPHPSVSTSQSSGTYAGVLPPSLAVLSSISGALGGPQYPFPSPMAISGMQGQRIVQPGQVVWNDRVRALYMEGADPSTANSPPALRCPRHLHTGCEICVEAKQFTKTLGGPTKGRPGAWGGEMTSRPPQSGSGQSMGGGGGGITGWQDGSGIGSGLANPGIYGSVLRRKSKWFQQDPEDAPYAGSGSGNTRLSELIPRFLRLSALVAMELGREIGDEEYEREIQGDGLPSTSPVTPQSPLLSRKAQSETEASPLRPSTDWYMLFAGLLTRAVLEGYLAGGWRGPDAAACLLSVGLGISDDPSVNDEDETDAIFEWFDPDDLPTLKEAAQIMFPSLNAMANGVTPRRVNAEADFAAEMKERLRRFYAIPPLTPDLSTHMEDLAWHFPAESVEQAAVRFCEAIARWRGKPELETYKKRCKDPTTPAMTIESLVHSNPTSPTSGGFSTQPSLPKSKRPPIEQYFIVPQSFTGRKRRRSGDDVDRFAKRMQGGMPVSAVSSHT